MKQTTSNHGKLFTNIPGIGLALIIAIPAWFAGKAAPSIGSAVFALVFGLGIGSLFRPQVCVPGLRFTGKKILQYSIILLGFEMSIGDILAIGSNSLIVMACTLAAAFVTTALFARILSVGEKPAILIGVGTCICGGSAIAATAPVIGADEDDVARAISTIFLFNIIAVFLFPFLGRLLGLDDGGFGLWAGTAINDTSSVVAAAASWGEVSGTGTALTVATIVKLTRTLLIIPITIALAAYTTRKDGHSAGNFRLARVFPWFVLGFIAAAVINSFIPLPAALPGTLANSGKFLIVVAMAAIGLSTNAKTLASSGKRPIALGLACWISISVVALLAQGLVGLLSNRF